MKKFFTSYIYIFFLSSLSHFALAQNNNVGIGGVPDASAQLDIKSTKGGLLIPRMSSSQRQTLPNITTGLMVYDTDTKSYWYVNSNKWSEVHFQLPYSASMSSFVPLFSLENTLNISQTALQVTAMGGTAIQGTATGTYSGIFGQNNSNGKGITGHNTADGVGVYARGLNGTALFADILNGYGDAGHLKQINSGGTAMAVQGNVRIHGGNNAEGIGKNFQCTNNGDGFWMMNSSGRIHVGFVANDFAGNGLNVFPNGTWSRYRPASMDYNFSNSFQTGTSSFVCPINGFYKFDATVAFDFNYEIVGFSEYVRLNGLRLMVKRNGVTSAVVENIEDFYPDRLLKRDFLTIENHVHLLAGDEVWLEIVQTRQYAGGVGSPSTITFNSTGTFSGNIVWADE